MITLIIVLQVICIMALIVGLVSALMNEWAQSSAFLSWAILAILTIEKLS